MTVFSSRRQKDIHKILAKCLHSSPSSLSFFSCGDEVMSNWISSASTLLNENISDVMSDVGRKKSNPLFMKMCCTFWCRKKHAKNVYSVTMRGGGGENCRIHIAVFRQHSQLDSRGLMDKLVLMFHSGFASTCQSTRFSFDR